MSLEIVKPYYKYKQEAYSKLNALFKGILRDWGFYHQYPALESEGLVFTYESSENLENMRKSEALLGYDPGEGLDCQVSVSVRGTTLLTFKGNNILYGTPNGGRSSLTEKELKVVRKCLTDLYKTGRTALDTVSNSFVYRLHSWYISPNICKFCSIRGETYSFIKS